MEWIEGETMIEIINLAGTKESTWHNFVLGVKGSSLTVSPGEYWQGGEMLYQSTKEKVFQIPLSNGKSYELYLLEDGIFLFDELITHTNPLMLMAWFTNTGALEDVPITFLRLQR